MTQEQLPFIEENDQTRARREHLEAIRALVGNAYPNKFARSRVTGDEDTITAVVTNEKIKEVMSRSTRLGMKTFDQALFELYETGFVSYEDALRNADSKNELRLRVKLESKRETKTVDDAAALQIVEEEPGRSL